MHGIYYHARRPAILLLPTGAPHSLEAKARQPSLCRETLQHHDNFLPASVLRSPTRGRIVPCLPLEPNPAAFRSAPDCHILHRHLRTIALQPSFLTAIVPFLPNATSTPPPPFLTGNSSFSHFFFFAGAPPALPNATSTSPPIHCYSTQHHASSQLKKYADSVFSQNAKSAEQDATNLATETLMDGITAREKEQEELTVDTAGGSRIPN